MSLTVISGAETLAHTWYESGSRHSIAGKQTVLAHQATGARLLLSESGVEIFKESDNFQQFVGDFAVINAMPGSLIRDFSSGLPVRNIRSARRTDCGRKDHLSTLYAYEGTPEVLIKTFDFMPKLALRQFDVMGFLGNRLKQANFGPTLSSPAQHAFLEAKNGGFKTILMEKLEYDRTEDNRPYELQIPKTPDLASRLKIISKIYLATLPLGPFLFNDFYRQNFMQSTDAEGNTQYYVIDQPQQRPFPFDPSRLAVPLSNGVLSLR